LGFLSEIVGLLVFLFVALSNFDNALEAVSAEEEIEQLLKKDFAAGDDYSYNHQY
tara:strand:- start:307 stop:471 length:165 start_codon:yes stop_codon:yes gene_type:complete